MQDTPHTPQPYADDEIDLLDLLVTVAENIKLLVVGPLLVGAAVFAYGYLNQSSTFVSESWLNLPQEKAVHIVSEDVFAKVLETNPRFLVEEPDPAKALKKLQQSVTANFNRNERMVRLTTRGVTPEEAQALNVMVVQSFAALQVPKGVQLDAAIRQIEIKRTSLAEIQNVVRRLAVKVDSVEPGTEADNVARAYVQLFREATELQTKVDEQERALLASDGSQWFIQSPSLNVQTEPNKKALRAIVATLATGFALLLFVFVRQALRNAGANPESATKLARIRRAFGLR